MSVSCPIEMKEACFGERLMCLWEAMYAITPEGQPVATDAVREVTHVLGEASSHITYQSMQFSLRFKEEEEVRWADDDSLFL